MRKLLIEMVNAVPGMPAFRFENPVNWRLYSDQHWAIVGPNGGGKTLFAHILTGKILLNPSCSPLPQKQEKKPNFQ